VRRHKDVAHMWPACQSAMKICNQHILKDPELGHTWFKPFRCARRWYHELSARADDSIALRASLAVRLFFCKMGIKASRHVGLTS
jgi:hypothetical protein